MNYIDDDKCSGANKGKDYLFFPEISKLAGIDCQARLSGVTDCVNGYDAGGNQHQSGNNQYGSDSYQSSC